TPELGDRDAFGLKVGPAGAVVQIFQVRGGRVVERFELVADAANAGLGARSSNAGARDSGAALAALEAREEGEVLQAALQQFYADRIAPPEVHIPVPFSEADTEMIEGWLSGMAERRVR